MQLRILYDIQLSSHHSLSHIHMTSFPHTTSYHTNEKRSHITDTMSHEYSMRRRNESRHRIIIEYRACYCYPCWCDRFNVTRPTLTEHLRVIQLGGHLRIQLINFKFSKSYINTLRINLTSE